MQSELNDWLLHPPEGCSLESFEPLTKWIIHMQGPENAAAPGLPRLYENELFRCADHSVLYNLVTMLACM